MKNAIVSATFQNVGMILVIVEPLAALNDMDQFKEMVFENQDAIL